MPVIQFCRFLERLISFIDTALETLKAFFKLCVCKSQNYIQNMSVSHKIDNMSVSHKIVIYRVFLRGADRGVLTMVCDGPNWCPVDYT